jgi:predicted signal transduction protein with EAL and GGDEF domain
MHRPTATGRGGLSLVLVIAVAPVCTEARGMDPLVASRRDLMVDLTRALAPGGEERLLALVRLHGLHDLRERVGPEGQDQLLAMAQRSLVLAVGRSGRAYQTRRDELCVLFDCPFETAIGLLDAVTAAVNEFARTSRVQAEAGVAVLPEEAADPISALERADRRILPSTDTGRGPGIASRRERRTLKQGIRLAG